MSSLAHRLRSLRDNGFPGVRVSQRQLVEAFSAQEPASLPLISGWENPDKPVIPNVSRLDAYATFFATERSVASSPFRVLDEAELTAEEKARREDLLRELIQLRDEADYSFGQSEWAKGSTWHYSDLEDVTIVCAELPERLRIPYAKPESPDYVDLYRYADLDALLELHGHIRAANPTNQVHFRTAFEMVPDDVINHLVVLGGVDWNAATRDVLRRVDLPVWQFTRDSDDDPGGFEVEHEGTRQVFRPFIDDDRQLHEDVAHFYRGRNPFNRNRTVSICNGMYARGTLAAVRALTDANFRDRNEAYLRERFTGRDGFSILFRVPIVSGSVVTPDWTVATIRLHEWPPRED